MTSMKRRDLLKAGGGMAVVATHIPLGLTGAKELTLGGRPASLTTGGATA